MQEPIAPFQMQPPINDYTYMQLIHIATKIVILQPNIGVMTGLDPSSVSKFDPKQTLFGPESPNPADRHTFGGILA
jgi:hypothetical protein